MGKRTRTTTLGIPELKAALSKARDETIGACEKAVRDETRAVADEMRSLAPVDTGNLRRSIRSRSVGLKGEARATAPYAIFVEVGSGAPAQPFAHPAAEISRSRFPRRVRAAVKKAVA